MILGFAGLISGLPLFFAGMYFSSRLGGWRSIVWGLAALAGLALSFACVLAIGVPGFFGGSR